MVGFWGDLWGPVGLGFTVWSVDGDFGELLVSPGLACACGDFC